MTDLTNALDIQQSSVQIQKYSWWNDPEKEIDIPHETEEARGCRPDLVIAKSLGTVIALNAFRELHRSCRFVFLGTPVSRYTKEYVSSLRILVDSTDILLIQQTNDELGSASELRLSLSENGRRCVSEISGDDHLYTDIPLLKSIIDPWLASGKFQVPGEE